MTKHIKPLTSLRGVAALLVVIHHFVGYMLPTSVGTTVSAYSKFVANGYLWVDLFFILSGFILTHVYANNFALGVNFANYKVYLFSRFARLYPLHIFMLFMFFGLEILKIVYFLWQNGFKFDFANAPFHPFSAKQDITAFIANIFMLQALDMHTPPMFGGNTYWNEPAWSISAESIVYLILPFVVFFILKSQKHLPALVYLSALCCLYLLIETTQGHLDFIGVPSLLRCALEGMLGIITYKVYQDGVYEKYFRVGSLATLSIAWIIIVMHFNWHDILVIPAFCLLILSASIIKNDNFILKSINSQTLLYLGKISYSIYMTHWFIQEFVKLVWHNLASGEFGSNFNYWQIIIVATIYIMVVLISASLTYNFIELPMRNNLKNLAVNQKSI